MRFLGILFLILAIAASAACADDTLVKEWKSGSTFYWTYANFTGVSGTASPWRGTTTSTNPQMFCPAMTASKAPVLSGKQYIQIRMRARLASGANDFYGASDARIFFITHADLTYNEAKMATFKTRGTGLWETYNVFLGDNPGWTGTLRQIQLDPCSTANAYIEIQYVRLYEDNTSPSFTTDGIYSPTSGQTIRDATPTITLRDITTDSLGISRAEFYWKQAGTADDWTIDGIDADAAYGYEYQYQALSPGSYDFGVRLYDRAGNSSFKTIDSVTIDPNAPTVIKVKPGNVVADLPKEVAGHNAMWATDSGVYNTTTNMFPAAHETSFDKLSIPVLRYPGGCHADTFYWKKSIGPQADRPLQYTNGCNPTLSSGAKTKYGLDEFLRFCERRNIKAMFTVRFRYTKQAGDTTPDCSLDGSDPLQEALDDAADLVEYCNSPNDGSNPNGGTDWAAVRAANGHPAPYNLKYYEIGNEPWGPDPFGSPRPNGQYGAEAASIYALHYLKFKNVMKAVDSSITVSASGLHGGQPGIANENTAWDRTIFDIIGNQVDAIHTHPYKPYSAFWVVDSDTRYWQTMAVTKRLDDDMEMYRQRLRQTGEGRLGNIKFWMNEWNVNYSWNWSNNIYEGDSLMANIALADIFSAWAVNGDIVQTTNYWHMLGGRPYNQLNSNGSLTNNGLVHSLYTTRYLDKIVKTDVNASPIQDFAGLSWDAYLVNPQRIPVVSAFATKSADGRRVSLTIVNKNTTDNISALVDLSDFTSGSVNADKWLLNGTNVHNTNCTTDYQHCTVTTSDAKVTTSSSTLQSVFTYDAPAHSVTNFVFTQIAQGIASLDALKGKQDAVYVSVESKAVSAVFGDSFYIQEAARTGGIKVKLPSGAQAPEVGSAVSVVGYMATDSNGERYIDAESVTLIGPTSAPTPVFMSVGSLGGGQFGLQSGVYEYKKRKSDDEWVRSGAAAEGLNNIGLLVKIAGMISSVALDNSHFYVDDGSGVDDGDPLVKGVRVDGSCPYQVGDFVCLTGISSCFKSGENILRLLKPRSAAEISILF